MGHHHHADGERPRRALLGALVVSGVFLVVEVVGAWWTGSLALAADAGHMFADVGGLALALFASWIATRPPTPAKTYGYQRAEILAALLNSLVLLVLAGAILYEAVQRLREPHPVPGGPLLVIGALGLGANAASAWMLRQQAQGNLNVRAAYLEVLGDALGSVGVLVAAVVIMVSGWTPIDSLVSVAIGLFIVARTWRLLAQVVNVLLEGTPAHLDVGEIEAAMRSVVGRAARARAARVDAHLRARRHERPRGGGRHERERPAPRRAASRAARTLRRRSHDHPARARYPGGLADQAPAVGGERDSREGRPALPTLPAARRPP